MYVNSWMSHQYLVKRWNFVFMRYADAQLRADLCILVICNLLSIFVFPTGLSRNRSVYSALILFCVYYYVIYEKYNAFTHHRCTRSS